MNRPDLQALREAIESVDREILALLKRRMELVDDVARAKIESAAPFRDRSREEQVIGRIRHLATELGLDAHEVERLYRDIMEMSIGRQQALVRSLEGVPLRVAYQGVEGSFSHLTAQRHYAGRNPGVLLTGHDTFREAVASLREGSVDFALLPIENTTAGSVHETYDLLAEGGVTITAEVVSHVEHCLLGLPGARVEEIRAVISHPQALAQCEAFLRTLPRAVARPEYDTAGSARKVRESRDPTLAAIASESAARLYGLEILARRIQTQEGNFTRFVEIAREAAACPPNAACKTSLLLALAHKPGALGEVLSRFGSRGVNLTRIESRPVLGSPWQYRFYLDLEGHAASEPVRAALDELGAITTEMRVLGTYPRAEER
ncbi:MAG TPA: prephenate dehydratase [Candidatus Eisenbacteria bacterium]|nr:prephenate dehydratase [Candidatus Eisenbacteria bacterium]